MVIQQPGISNSFLIEHINVISWNEKKIEKGVKLYPFFGSNLPVKLSYYHSIFLWHETSA
jgi:hypothetical protein